MDARRHVLWSVATLLLLLLRPAGAQGQGGDLGTEWQPVDPGRLAQMRGGFQMPSGMTLSFGIERVVFVNGALTARIAVQIPDVARITPEQAQALADFNRGLVVQIGDGNRVDPAQVAGGLVIQNTLDDQDIRTLTRIDVGTDTLGAYQHLNASGALTDALLRAPGGP
jgi:hypothetical protein